MLSEISAHSSPLETLAWSHDASLLASASTKGTVIRVHRMPQVKPTTDTGASHAPAGETHCRPRFGTEWTHPPSVSTTSLSELGRILPGLPVSHAQSPTPSLTRIVSHAQSHTFESTGLALRLELDQQLCSHLFPTHTPDQASKAFTLRRGTRPATIHSLAFSPPGVHPPLLAATSSHGSVHLFRSVSIHAIRPSHLPYLSYYYSNSRFCFLPH